VDGGQEVVIFRQTLAYKFPTEEIMDAQNFNFACKFSKHVLAQYFVLLDDNFETVQILGWAAAPLYLPSSTTPRTAVYRNAEATARNGASLEM